MSRELSSVAVFRRVLLVDDDEITQVKKDIINAAFRWVEEYEAKEGDVTAMLFTSHNALVRAVNNLKKKHYE